MNKIDKTLLNLFNAIDEAKRQLLDAGSLEMSSEVKKFENGLISHPDISRHLENIKRHTKHTLTEKDKPIVMDTNKEFEAAIRLFLRDIGVAKDKLVNLGNLEEASAIREYELNFIRRFEFDFLLKNIKASTLVDQEQMDKMRWDFGKTEHTLKEEECPPHDQGSKKPPLGIKPRKLHKEDVELQMKGFGQRLIKERIKEITSAMVRYIEATKKIPVEWFKELDELTSQL